MQVVYVEYKIWRMCQIMILIMLNSKLRRLSALKMGFFDKMYLISNLSCVIVHFILSYITLVYI